MWARACDPSYRRQVLGAITTFVPRPLDYALNPDKTDPEVPRKPTLTEPLGFYDPAGKRKCRSCGVGSEGEKAANKLSAKIAAELLTGTYESTEKKTWQEFRKEYESKVMDGMAPGSRQCTAIALDHFERIVKPKRVQSITSRTFAEYIAERRTEEGLRSEPVSPATINKELRHLRAAIRKAFRWEYLKRVPAIDFLKQPGKLRRTSRRGISRRSIRRATMRPCRTICPIWRKTGGAASWSSPT
jgi:hypothetical protein